MVITQSCDLVHRDLRNEPSAVVLILKAINSGDPGLMHGRNPRVIHVQARDESWLEAWAWNQAVVPRDHLATKDANPTFTLHPKVLGCVLDWLAKRFTRIAFPDGFNDSLKPKSNLIGKLLKKNHALFSEILLSVTPFDDLAEGQHYELACYLLMEIERHDDPNQLAEARTVASKLERLFEDCGIEVLECSPVSEGTLTVAEFNNLLTWDYDHLTHRASTDSSHQS